MDNFYSEKDLSWIVRSDDSGETAAIPLRTLAELVLAAKYVVEVASYVPNKRRDLSYWEMVEWAQVAYDRGLDELTRIRRSVIHEEEPWKKI